MSSLTTLINTKRNPINFWLSTTKKIPDAVKRTGSQHRLILLCRKYTYIYSGHLKKTLTNGWFWITEQLGIFCLVTGAPTSNIQPTLDCLQVKLPNESQGQSIHTCVLILPQLPENTHPGHIIPGLASYSLLLLVRLCNKVWHVTFIKIDYMALHHGWATTTGSKYTRTELWMFLLTNETNKIFQEVSTMLAPMPGQPSQPLLAQPTALCRNIPAWWDHQTNIHSSIKWCLTKALIILSTQAAERSWQRTNIK